MILHGIHTPKHPITISLRLELSMYPDQYQSGLRLPHQKASRTIPALWNRGNDLSIAINVLSIRLICLPDNRSVNRPFSSSFDKNYESEAYGQKMKLEPFAGFISEPVHEEPVLQMHHEYCSEHDYGYPQGG